MSAEDFPPFDPRDRPEPSHHQAVCPSPECGELRLFPKRPDGSFRCMVCGKTPPEDTP